MTGDPMAGMDLTVVICTHNREPLLRRSIASLDRVRRPDGCGISILVVANGCTDGTVAWLSERASRDHAEQGLPLAWVDEPVLGKSHALNRAVELLETPLAVFIDDDQRVHEEFFHRFLDAVQAHPEAMLFCGKLLPDWDGSEPGWVHETGRFRIYPPPVPMFDAGDQERLIDGEGSVPGGGNLFLRTGVFSRFGGFSTALGPTGHNFGGGEDSDFILRVLAAGEQMRYLPDVIQYHYVDPGRLRLWPVVVLAYQRSRSITEVHGDARGRIPLYMWRKAIENFLRVVVSLRMPARRFYLVRLAASLGEISGFARAARGSLRSAFDSRAQ